MTRLQLVTLIENIPLNSFFLRFS